MVCKRKEMTRSLYCVLFILSVFYLSACGEKKEDSSRSNDELTKVAEYSDDTTLIITYFSKSENWEKLAADLWHEKEQMVKDSSKTYYLFVFNDLKYMPDPEKEQKALWNANYMNYKSCVLDNGFGFVRFCYEIRYDVGRVGDWQNFRYVKSDGSLSEYR